MVEITVDSESRAAHTCFSIATNCQGLAHLASEKWEIEHHCTTGIIFVAFSIEAMINHFGKIMFKDKWEAKRTNRKEQHRIFFKSVNLPSYLGTENYQIANKCFEIRDNFAHGKTKDETLKVTISDDISHEDLVRQVVYSPTSMESLATIENLDKYIEIAHNIEDDIQEHGYYPGQDHIPKEEREKLLECPLNVTGIRTFLIVS